MLSQKLSYFVKGSSGSLDFRLDLIFPPYWRDKQVRADVRGGVKKVVLLGGANHKVA